LTWRQRPQILNQIYATALPCTPSVRQKARARS